jgi:hypothetical protein
MARSRTSFSLSSVCSRSGKATLSKHGHRVEERVLLKDHPEAATGLRQGDVAERCDVGAVDHDAARGRSLEGDEVAHQGALARARAADHHQGLRAVDGEVHPVQHGAVAVGLHQLLDDDVGVAHGQPTGVSRVVMT